MDIKATIDSLITEFPVCQYEIVDSSEIPFSEKVRSVCKQECPCYGKSWSCPPATGEVSECIERCKSYKHALIFTTLAEVADAELMTETLKTRAGHEEVTRGITAKMKEAGFTCMPLSSESCNRCETCAYPEPCRFPDLFIPCVESYGIVVVLLAEKFGIDFYYDPHTITWFGIIFFN